VLVVSASRGADDWVPDIPFDAAAMQMFGGGVGYYRAPSDPQFPQGDSRSLGRHNKRCNFGFFDGHAQALRNSAAGYQFQRQDDRAWWTRDHTYSSPYGT
jgi:prepilin-type processing-associated H-X9-DG protein